jgi:hypothetical protein
VRKNINKNIEEYDMKNTLFCSFCCTSVNVVEAVHNPSNVVSGNSPLKRADVGKFVRSVQCGEGTENDDTAIFPAMEINDKSVHICNQIMDAVASRKGVSMNGNETTASVPSPAPAPSLSISMPSPTECPSSPLPAPVQVPVQAHASSSARSFHEDQPTLTPSPTSMMPIVGEHAPAPAPAPSVHTVTEVNIPVVTLSRMSSVSDMDADMSYQSTPVLTITATTMHAPHAPIEPEPHHGWSDAELMPMPIPPPIISDNKSVAEQSSHTIEHKAEVNELVRESESTTTDGANGGVGIASYLRRCDDELETCSSEHSEKLIARYLQKQATIRLNGMNELSDTASEAKRIH